MKKIVVLAFIFLFVTACSTTTPAPPATPVPPTDVPPTAEPIPTDTPEPLPSNKVIFDGNECVLSGPAELVTGAHLIGVQNTSESKGWMRICWTREDYTWQDILDFDFTDDDDVDDDIEWPAWCLGNPTFSVASAHEDTVVYEYKFRHEGMYFLLWEQSEPELAYRCGPLSVSE